MTRVQHIFVLAGLFVCLAAGAAGARWNLEKPFGAPGPHSNHWCPAEEGCWVFEGTVYGDYAITPIENRDGGEQVPLTAAQCRQRAIEMQLLIDGEARPGRLDADGKFHWSHLDFGAPGEHSLRWRVSEAAGDGAERTVQDGPENVVDVLPNVFVQVANVSFGVVPAGCGEATSCQELDFQGSRALAAQPELSFSLAGETDLPLVLRHGDTERDLAVGDEPLLLRYDGTPIQVCAMPGKCAGASQTDQVVLHVAPADPRLANHEDGARRGEAQLTAEVQPDWLACHLWWMLTLLALIILGLIVYGIVKPHRFPPSATIQIHAKESKLARSPGQAVPNAPGGRPGFYRDAYCAFNAGGQFVRRREGPALLLSAAAGYQVRIDLRGVAVERKSRGKWKTIDTKGQDDKSLHETHLQSGAVYRVGQSFFFRVSL